MTRDPQHNQHHTPPLPDEVWDALATESAEDRAALAEAWALTESYFGNEPSEATFQQMGADIWRNLESAIQAETPPTPLRLVPSQPRVFKLQRWHQMAVAACVALLLGVAFVLSQQPITHSAPFGDTATIDLPDGSQVLLNSGATLSHSRNFGSDQRNVTLNGEAFFTVAKAETPFNVETFNGVTTVLGTEFNVRAWEDDITPATEVAVLSGTVRLAAQQTAQALTLQAGESARLMAQSATPVPLEDEVDNALAWRKGSFKLVKPVGTVLRELERRYNLTIMVEDEALLMEPIAILKEAPLDVEEILSDICESQGYEYQAITGGYEIKRADAE